MTTDSFSQEQGKPRRYIFRIIRGLNLCFNELDLLFTKKVFWRPMASVESNDFNIHLANILLIQSQQWKN